MPLVVEPDYPERGVRGLTHFPRGEDLFLGGIPHLIFSRKA